MTIAKVRHILDRYDISYDPEAVPLGVYGSGVMTKFWPYKLAGLLIHGETAGIRKLPGHLILAPMPALSRLCPVKAERIREHLESAVSIGLLDAVEFYSNHALITVPATAWETGALDTDGKFASLEVDRVVKPAAPPTPPSAPCKNCTPKRPVGRPRKEPNPL